jgi:hypothetical protein
LSRISVSIDLDMEGDHLTHKPRSHLRTADELLIEQTREGEQPGD